jgi:two-component system, NtrC family, sensor histidine kinase HydH
MIDPEPSAEAFVESVAAGIAHEVRNPLNALQINLRILEQELLAVLPDRRAHAYEVLQNIASELSHLDHFVSEFLRYARPPQLRIERVAVRALVGELVTFVRPECARKGVQLTADLPDALPSVQADGFQLKRALLNLVLNALQATPVGGTVTLSAEADANQLRLAVRDRGEGMDAAQLARVFELFYTTREGGTGLGLPIARRIVAAHGGTLTLASTAGQGTIATLTLPLAPAQGQ